MASFRKIKSGWRAEIVRKGVRRSKVLPTKREAQDWAAREEYLILNGEKVAAAMSLGEVLDRYAREISPTKRGERWEVIRLEAFQRDPVALVRLADLEPAHLAKWRDRRLAVVAPSSVRREMNLMGAVLSQARREWGLIARNPMEDVRKPPDAPPRQRLPTDSEVERLALSAGEDLGNATARAFHAFLFSGETAMRAGEIVGMTWERVDLAGRVIDLPKTKNGRARQVPLSSAAVALLEALPAGLAPVFGLSSRQLDALWRKLRDRAGVDGLVFHDARAWGLTKLSRKVDVLTLARISGHQDLSMLSRVYYRESAADIAKRLD